MNLSKTMHRMRTEIGFVGIVSLALIACGLAFQFSVLQPLEKRRVSLEQRVTQSFVPGRGAQEASSGLTLPRFYRYFESSEDAPTQLAKLHMIGKAAGLDLRAAQYKVDRSGPRILRYEITLPLAGNYSQIRAFLKNALAEIPVLSLDQVNLKKDRPGEGPVLADVRMTLHLLQP